MVEIVERVTLLCLADFRFGGILIRGRVGWEEGLEPYDVGKGFDFFSTCIHPLPT